MVSVAFTANSSLLCRVDGRYDIEGGRFVLLSQQQLCCVRKS